MCICKHKESNEYNLVLSSFGYGPCLLDAERGTGLSGVVWDLILKGKGDGCQDWLAI